MGEIIIAIVICLIFILIGVVAIFGNISDFIKFIQSLKKPWLYKEYKASALKAVEKTNNQDDLKCIAKEAVSLKVKLEAAKKLTDENLAQEVFTNIVKETKDRKFRDKVAKRLVDQSVITEILKAEAAAEREKIERANQIDRDICSEFVRCCEEGAFYSNDGSTVAAAHNIANQLIMSVHRGFLSQYNIRIDTNTVKEFEHDYTVRQVTRTYKEIYYKENLVHTQQVSPGLYL